MLSAGHVVKTRLTPIESDDGGLCQDLVSRGGAAAQRKSHPSQRCVAAPLREIFLRSSYFAVLLEYCGPLDGWL